jgi:hypothetical protein
MRNRFAIFNRDGDLIAFRDSKPEAIKLSKSHEYSTVIDRESGLEIFDQHSWECHKEGERA